jgi:thiamine biosynthesis protein ThiS
VRIQVNGEARITKAESTVSELLQDLDLKSDRVAVELNLEILDRKEFGTRQLREGDRVEILSFIGGGSGGSSAGIASLLPERAPAGKVDVAMPVGRDGESAGLARRPQSRQPRRSACETRRGKHERR